MPKNVAEDMVETTLNQMRKDNIIPGYLKNQQSDRLDSEGIDFLIFLWSGLALPLQVKTFSSKNKYRDSLEEHLRKHPNVHFLISVNIHTYKPEAVYRYISREIRTMVRRAMAKPPFRPPA